MLKSAKESKRDAFLRIGEARMLLLIKAMRQLGNLSNRNAYDYEPADVDRMADALIAEIDQFKLRMENRKRSVGFSFQPDEESHEGDQTSA